MRKLLLATRLYWRAIFSIIWPLLLLSIIIIDDSKPRRCLFVILLMIGYWMTEAIHIIITSFLPIVLFPILNVMGTNEICSSYMQGANMMFLAGVMLASAVQYSRLHERIALMTISTLGCSPKKLHLGIIIISALTSMWISNAATTNLMIPIVSSILSEFESQGIVLVFYPPESNVSQMDVEQLRKPTEPTMCYYISIAYASIIGSMGTIIGAEANLTFKGQFETTFKEAPTISFGYFMLMTMPIVTIILIFSTLVLQIWFLGLFRPKSREAQLFVLGDEVEAVVKTFIDSKRRKLGSVTFHEIAVLACYILVILLWIIRSSHMIAYWTRSMRIYIEDSSIGIIVVLLMFCIPAKPHYVSIKREKNQPGQVISRGLTTWKLIQKTMPWGVIFLIGSGLAITKAIEISGMDNYIISMASDFKYIHPYLILIATCGMAGFLTQFTTNVVVANIMLPIMIDLARELEINPLYFMYPVTLSCTFTYMFPVSAPPNSVAAMACTMPTTEMIKIGFLIFVISLLVLFAAMTLIYGAIWDLHTVPDWAKVPHNRTVRKIYDLI